MTSEEAIPILECWQIPTVRADRDAIAALLRSQQADIEALVAEREKATRNRAAIVVFSHTAWGEGEYVVTAEGEPIGCTLSKHEAAVCVRWVASAWADLIAVNAHNLIKETP